MKKTNSPPVFENILRSQGNKIGLRNLSEVARYMDYKERNFLNRVKHQSFTIPELLRIFKALHFSNQDILEFFGRST